MKHLKISKLVFIIMSILFLQLSLFASDRTDALDLMKKCDLQSKEIEIAIKNFGDDKELAQFDKGLKMIKMGKVKIAQSKYLDAKAQFTAYLELEYQLYQSLAEKYIERTRILIDDIAVDLADFIGENDVLKAFEEANNYLQSAKSSYARKQYNKVIGPCRYAKFKIITLYETVKKETPEQYLKDLSDYQKKIHQAE